MEHHEIKEMLSINSDNLEEDFIQAPEIMAYVNEQFSKAQNHYMAAKYALERVEAKLTLTIKERLIEEAKENLKHERHDEAIQADLAKKEGLRYKRVEFRLRTPTVSDITSAVILEPEYRECRVNLIHAESDMLLWKGYCDAARVKRDMLTNIGMRINAETRLNPMSMANAKNVMNDTNEAYRQVKNNS